MFQDNSVTLNKGIELIKQATEEDRNENYQDAYNKYILALEYFNHACKYERNPKMKETICLKAAEYLARAEQLKKYLADLQSSGLNNRTRKAAMSDESHNGTGPSPDATETDEHKQLKTGLESAIVKEKPNVSWTDVIGLDVAKDALKEAVIIPLKFPNLFTGKRTPWTGILLFGPPGTGKSFLAKAVATEANSTFFSLSSSDLVSKWVGQSERLVKNLFQLARENRPAIIFVDEIDSLCSARSDTESESARRIKTEFMTQMNGVGTDNSGILVLGATNIPWCLDPAIRRRFEKRIYISLPDKAARALMFKSNLGGTKNSLSEDDFKEFAQRSEGYSGADISIVVRDALYMPIRRIQEATHFKKVLEADPARPGEYLERYTPCSLSDPAAIEMGWMDLTEETIHEPDVTRRDMLMALETTKPTVNHADLEKQIEFTREFGQKG